MPRPIAAVVLLAMSLAIRVDSWAQSTSSDAAAGIAQASERDPAPPEFAAWWARLFTFNDGSLFDGVAVSYDVFYVYIPTAERLDEMRRTVKDKPEHPLRSQLQSFERAIENPRGRWMTLTVISRGGEWRANRNEPQGEYRDYAWSKESAFELSRTKLLVTKPSPEASEARRFAQVSSDFLSSLDAVLTSGVGQAGNRMLHFKPVFAGSKWTMSGRLKELTPGETCDMQLTGSWDPATHTGRIERVRSVIRRADGTVLNLGSDSSEFQYEPLLDLQIPRVMIRYHEDGQPRFEYRFKEARKVSASEMRDLLKVPTPNGTDPVRGKLEFTKVEDYRGGSESASLATGMPTPPSASKGDSSLRWLGWAAAGGLVALFVGLKLRKSASS